MYDDGWYHHGMDTGDWWLMSVMMVVLLGVLVVTVVVLLRGGWSGGRWDRSSRREDPGPGRILDERFARGEIDADELLRARDALRGGGSRSVIP